jgi:peptidoglycan hydrolase-like protein with peptidoglycan-binding domain
MMRRVVLSLAATVALVLGGLGVGVTPAVAKPGVPDIGLWSTNKRGVKCVQVAMNRLSSAGLDVDLIYGPDTKQAVVNFQTFFGIAPTGVVNGATGDMIQYIWDLRSHPGNWANIGCYGAVPSAG